MNNYPDDLSQFDYLEYARQFYTAFDDLPSSAELHGCAGGVWWSASLGPSAAPLGHEVR
jgi:hypothetical protein